MLNQQVLASLKYGPYLSHFHAPPHSVINFTTDLGQAVAQNGVLNEFSLTILTATLQKLL